jgi:ribosomal protein S8
MYKWISEKSETSFELPIDRIKRGYDSTKIRKDIIDFLKHEKIAFFDVIDKVIRRDHSSKDDDILFCTLDGGNLLKRLCNVKNNQNLIIIVNSNKALKMFYKILCNSEFVFEKRSKKSSEGSFQGYIHSAKDKKDIIAAVHLVSQSPIMTKYDVAKSWENAIGYVMSNRKDEEPFSDSLNFIIDSDSTSLLSMDNSKHVG